MPILSLRRVGGSERSLGPAAAKAGVKTKASLRRPGRRGGVSTERVLPETRNAGADRSWICGGTEQVQLRKRRQDEAEAEPRSGTELPTARAESGERTAEAEALKVARA